MTSLIYAPVATVRIHSTKLDSVIDVSDDCTSGSVTRALGPSLSTVQFTLLNRARKYDGVFSPMDRVVVYMRRIKTMITFAGYLDEVPLWSAIGGSVSVSGSCTLKRLQNFYWDPGAPASTALFSVADEEQNLAATNDGGLSLRTVDLLTKVGNWDKDQIHIGAVPNDWFTALEPLAAQQEEDAEQVAQDLLGESLGTTSAAVMGGQVPVVGTSSVTGIGPGTGTIPATSGKCSSFGGPGGGAYGNFALTGESGVHPNDPFYCAMRWPYVTASLQPIAGLDVGKVKAWWANRHILVTNPKTGRSVVVRAADWGPNVNTGRVIDLGPQAIQAIGADTDDVVNIAFAPEGSALGPVSSSAPSASQSPVSTSGGSSAAITSGWTTSSSDMAQFTAQGITFTANKMAGERFVGFVNDLAGLLHYHPKVIYGYFVRDIAGSSTLSNHAYGAAIDIDPNINPRYGTSAGGSYALPRPPAIIQLARKWGLDWGGEYHNSKDYMHFEVIGAPASPAYTPAPAGPTAVTNGSGGSAAPSQQTQWTPPIPDPPATITTHFGDTGPHWAHGHSGTDFANGHSGTPINPVGPGTVFAVHPYSSDYGNSITVDHGQKVYTFYAHMEQPSTLAVGAQVDPSSQLGTVGSTGNTTGPHVHLELRLDADTYDAALASGGIEKYIQGVGKSLPPRGVPGAGSADVSAVDGDPTYSATNGGQGVTSASLDNIGGALLNVANLVQSGGFSEESQFLTGVRALMNDEPLMNTVQQYMTTGFRDFCSAPNGDFIGWFPDYFGHYQQAGKMVISPLEIDIESPPVVRWGDSSLKTHEFTVGQLIPGTDNSGAGPTAELQAEQGSGFISIENYQMMSKFLNITLEEAKALAATSLRRYGARPEVQHVSSLTGVDQELYYSVQTFLQNWSAQWRTTINITFMPELFPGMLLCFPVYGVQGYVREVTHSWDYTSSGFTTQVSCAPWSTLGKGVGPEGMVVGAPL